MLLTIVARPKWQRMQYRSADHLGCNRWCKGKYRSQDPQNSSRWQILMLHNNIRQRHMMQVRLKNIHISFYAKVADGKNIKSRKSTLVSIKTSRTHSNYRRNLL